MIKRLPSIAALLVAAYFAYLASFAIHAHFAVDDPTNLGYYYRRGFATTLLDTARFWSTAYRPMGGLFYLPIYYLFHLNPLPYRIVILALIASNIALTWRIAERLTESKAAPALASALMCGHAAMITIYLNTSMIYDVLTYFFTALMLAVYVGVRSRSRELTGMQTAIVILAYIAAIDSKEIAVVAAGWVLAYEILIRSARRWATPVALMAIGAIYTAGKMMGPHALAQDPGYRIEFTLHRYLLNNEIYWNSLFYSEYFQNSRRLLIEWGLLTLLCMLFRKREVWWCWFLVSTATLAISFTVVPRDGAALYLPLLAWALLVSAMVASVPRHPASEWAAGWVIIVLIAGLWTADTIHRWRDEWAPFLATQDLTWSVITQVRELPRPAPGSRVMILSSPFNGWDAYFIAELAWNDRSIQIQMGDKSPQPPSAEELKSFDWVLAFDRDILRVVRRP
ncbi:MAG TPA: hypothetical protein VK419_16325 [Bryobacteraceae bacterium]|nr:hypothetical protein [Bryobacteraceae bacterium]